tara:strand:+ start:258 stop:596 length:339 start_codon:yes stop_codon:yes gene_type:complete
MNPLDQQHQAPEPQWTQPVEPADQSSVYLRRIAELEQQVETYEALLEELPDLFERKFQQRLEPLIERYRLLADASGRPNWLDATPEPTPRGNVLRFPRFQLPGLFKTRQRSA